MEDENQKGFKDFDDKFWALVEENKWWGTIPLGSQHNYPHDIFFMKCREMVKNQTEAYKRAKAAEARADNLEKLHAILSSPPLNDKEKERVKILLEVSEGWGNNILELDDVLLLARHYAENPRKNIEPENL